MFLNIFGVTIYFSLNGAHVMKPIKENKLSLGEAKPEIYSKGNRIQNEVENLPYHQK